MSLKRFLSNYAPFDSLAKEMIVDLSSTLNRKASLQGKFGFSLFFLFNGI